ncbi:MAG: HIT family protein [bacterium]
MECLFCKIISNQIPSHVIYEDDHALAFLDIFPHAKGHAVVVPKKHYENMEEMPTEQLEKLIGAIQATMLKVKKALEPTGFNIGINDGKSAGQVIPHVHWHVLPRYNDDKGGTMHSIIKNSGNLSAEQVFEIIKKVED